MAEHLGPRIARRGVHRARVEEAEPPGGVRSPDERREGAEPHALVPVDQRLDPALGCAGRRSVLQGDELAAGIVAIGQPVPEHQARTVVVGSCEHGRDQVVGAGLRGSRLEPAVERPQIVVGLLLAAGLPLAVGLPLAIALREVLREAVRPATLRVDPPEPREHGSVVVAAQRAEQGGPDGLGVPRGPRALIDEVGEAGGHARIGGPGEDLREAIPDGGDRAARQRVEEGGQLVGGGRCGARRPDPLVAAGGSIEGLGGVGRGRSHRHDQRAQGGGGVGAPPGEEVGEGDPGIVVGEGGLGAFEFHGDRVSAVAVRSGPCSEVVRIRAAPGYRFRRLPTRPWARRASTGSGDWLWCARVHLASAALRHSAAAA